MFTEALVAQDLDVAARTIYGEARGEAFAGKLAVAWVIINRAERGGWWGDTIESVCKRKGQFSCWRFSDPNHEKMLKLQPDSAAYQECLYAVSNTIVGDDDPTDGATHYHAKSVNPSWNVKYKSRKIIGNHIFYTGVE